MGGYMCICIYIHFFASPSSKKYIYICVCVCYLLYIYIYYIANGLCAGPQNEDLPCKYGNACGESDKNH